jgi:hypothetical protein
VSLYPLIQYSGTSMATVFKPKQELVLLPVHHLELGEIYVFRMNDEFVVHRLINIEDKRAEFKGDFALTSEWIEIDHIMGRVEGPIPIVYLLLAHFYTHKVPRGFQILGKVFLKTLSFNQ